MYTSVYATREGKVANVRLHTDKDGNVQVHIEFAHSSLVVYLAPDAVEKLTDALIERREEQVGDAS